jgi:hypothetical protein
MTQPQDPVTRAVELFVYAPVGAGLFLLDEAPGFVEAAVERGRMTLDARITTARSTGELALAFGVPILRRKVEARVARLLGREPVPAAAPEAPTPPRETPVVAAAAPEARPTEPRPTEPWAPAPPPAPKPSPTPSYAHAAPTNGAPSSADLPIPGYDELSASQVVERLVGLAPGELDAVHTYEAANRQRRTILGKIEQLASSPGA